MLVSRLKCAKSAQQRTGLYMLLCLVACLFAFAASASAGPPPGGPVGSPTHNVYWDATTSLGDEGQGVIRAIAYGSVYDDCYDLPHPYKLASSVSVDGNVIWDNSPSPDISTNQLSPTDFSYDLTFNLVLLGFASGVHKVEFIGVANPNLVDYPDGGANGKIGWDDVYYITVP